MEQQHSFPFHNKNFPKTSHKPQTFPPIYLKGQKIQNTKIIRFYSNIIFMIRNPILRFSFTRYTEAFREAKENPDGYWRKEAEKLQWFTFPKQILDRSNPPFYRWFNGGKMNITHNLLDRNMEMGLGKQVAYHVESPITGAQSYQITIEELERRVSALADALVKDFKLKDGDTAIIYMPMALQSIIAQFACARIGVIHSVVFGGFAAPQLAIRMKDCQPKIVICSSAGKQPNKVIDYEKIIFEACQIANMKNIPVIIHQRKFHPREISKNLKNFYDFMQVEKSGGRQPAVSLDSNHPLYILYTSGTTGAPKGIYRDHGGTAVLLNHAMQKIFDLKPNDGLFCTSDIGWVLGHSFITYGPLLKGVRSILYEGKPIGTPDAGIFWRLVEKCKINQFYTSPTAMRGIRKEDPEGAFITKDRIKTLKGLTLVGERCDVETFKWVQTHFEGKFINDTYWQTQTGCSILSNYQGFEPFPPKPGSACKPMPGYDLTVLNHETRQPCKPNETGYIVMKEPTPPSFMLSLWKRDEAFIEKYFKQFPGYYETGDSGYFDEDGYFYIMSRVDDVINTAGHRLSTGQMEEILMKNNKLAEAVVIGAKDELKGEIPVGFVTLKTGVTLDDPHKLQKQLITLIRHDIGPVASFKICYVVNRLPKTRSGKYLRNVIRKIYNREQYVIPSTIEDIEVVKQIQEYLEKERRPHD